MVYYPNAREIEFTESERVFRVGEKISFWSRSFGDWYQFNVEEISYYYGCYKGNDKFDTRAWVVYEGI